MGDLVEDIVASFPHTVGRFIRDLDEIERGIESLKALKGGSSYVRVRQIENGSK